MTGLLSYKSKQFLWLVLKLLIVILCGYFIYDILTKNEELKINDFHSFLINSDVFSIKNILFLLFFSLFNWFLEITKWRFLVKKIKSISWLSAAKQSLASLTFSLITPNRIGEYGAKALYYSKQDRKEVVILNFAGNFYQLLVTVGMGVFGVLYLAKYFSPLLSKIPVYSLVTIIVLILIIFLVIRFMIQRIPWMQLWYDKIIDSLNLINSKENRNIFYLSFLRYLVFSHQFYFLVVLFQIDMDYTTSLAAITSMYLLSSVVPMLSIFDFVLKGSIAVFLFGFFDVTPLVILSITTLMWIFNFAFPAIIGSYFVLRFKPIQS